MDFITDLPTSDGFDSIFVVLDRLSKMGHFFPCNKSIDAKETSRLYLDNIYRHHGLPDSIISDRGPQFISKFWKSLHGLLGTDIDLSSAFHPETNGQSERSNQEIERYLRIYTDYQQDDWVRLHSTAEFSFNNTQSASTGMTPFFANFGYHPRADALPKRERSDVPAATDLVNELDDLRTLLKLELERAQAVQVADANVHRQPAPNFEIGQKVWLLRKNIKTTRPSEKLDHKRLGPFEIIGQINRVAFRLKLQKSMKIHDVFHVSLLEPYHVDSNSDRKQPPPPPVSVDNEDEFEVEQILDSRYRHNQLQYFVDWKGYGVDERSWEPVSNVKNSLDLVKDFHARYPDKPGPGGRDARPKRRGNVGS
jgi:hypothetical protein